jgi:phosphoenolpyruvate carboxykinase (ATP)
VPSKVLNPRNTWADKKKDDETATRLVGMFKKNFKKYEPNVTADVANVM